MVAVSLAIVAAGSAATDSRAAGGSPNVDRGDDRRSDRGGDERHAADREPDRRRRARPSRTASPASRSAVPRARPSSPASTPTTIGCSTTSPRRAASTSLKGDETLPVWLQRSGYYTALVGKYLNGYETSAVGVPPGWTRMARAEDPNAYYGYDLIEDGQLVRYGDPTRTRRPPPRPTRPTSTPTRRSTSSPRAPLGEPYFLWVAYNAPHTGEPGPAGRRADRCRGNAKPAPRHSAPSRTRRCRGRRTSTRPTSPTSRARSGTRRRSISFARSARDHDLYRCELESLLAVDEGVQRIVEALAATGELDDPARLHLRQRLLHGEHRIPLGKNLPYEESIRVPLLIRGPGSRPGARATTWSRTSTWRRRSSTPPAPPPAARGRPLAAAADPPARRRRGRELAIEGNRYRGVRTPRYIYVALDPRSRPRRDRALRPRTRTLRASKPPP